MYIRINIITFDFKENYYFHIEEFRERFIMILMEFR